MWEFAAVLVCLGSALMVSYARARAEALGTDCKVGFMSRPERLVGLIIGFVFAGLEPFGVSILTFMICLIAVLTPHHRRAPARRTSCTTCAPRSGRTRPGPDARPRRAAPDAAPAGVRGRGPTTAVIYCRAFI